MASRAGFQCPLLRPHDDLYRSPVNAPLAHPIRKPLNLVRNLMKLVRRIRGQLNCHLPVFRFGMRNDCEGPPGPAQRLDQKLPPYITVITHALVLGALHLAYPKNYNWWLAKEMRSPAMPGPLLSRPINETA